MEPAQETSLETLLQHLTPSAQVSGSRDLVISALTIDSRSAVPGSLFIAMRGEHTDGHHFIAQAIERGACAVVTEEVLDIDPPVTAIVVPDTARAASQLADAFYGRPSQSLSIAGVTGTNGKTTTTQMIAAMLNGAGIRCGSIGTIGARLDDREWPLANTTPLAPELHALLEQMRARGANAVAMEVSSHALALQRVSDVRFTAGALTNLTRDHLDFHKSFEAYAGAKRKLLDAAHACVINLDDEIGERWSRELRLRKPVLTYGLAGKADLNPERLDVRANGSSFELGGLRVEVRLPGRFNVSNALCAFGVTRLFGVADAEAARGLSSLDRVAGRMEHVRGHGVDVIVDYAHTPDALENVLRAARELTGGRVLLVFGCGGDRDRGKRPEMGAVAARLADYTYITSDNPRTEEPQEIADAIAGGMRSAPHAVLLDRRAAIEGAIGDARAGEVVVVAGKGHENYQIFATQTLPFDDVQVVREALSARSGVHS